MIIEKIPIGERNSFFLAMEKHLNPLQKRNVSFTINVHSRLLGEITMYLSGRRGTVVKNFVFMYNNLTEDWDIYSEGYKYSVNSLSQITTIVKNKIQKLTPLLSKI